MKELKVGKFPTKEIIDWFGVEPNTFWKYKKRKIQILQQYCDFEESRGYITINKVYYPHYVKNLDKRDVELYHKMVTMIPNKISTIKAISDEIERRDLPYYEGVSERTVQYRMSEAGKIAYGVTRDEESQGVYGNRKYRWAVKTGREWPNCYRELTPIERDIFADLMKVYYCARPEKSMQRELLLQAFREDEEMTKEEYFDLLELYEVNDFMEVINQFHKRTGYWIVNATQHFEHREKNKTPQK